VDTLADRRSIATRSSHRRILDCETKRIAYVALSRAAQRLTVVAPSTAAQPWRAIAEDI
jgi:hypothetical protein